MIQYKDRPCSLLTLSPRFISNLVFPVLLLLALTKLKYAGLKSFTTISWIQAAGSEGISGKNIEGVLVDGVLNI